MGFCFTSCKYILFALGFIMIFGALFWLFVDMFHLKGQIGSWSKYIPNSGIISTATGTLLGAGNQTFISNSGILTLGKGKTTLDNEGNINATGTAIISGLLLKNDTIYFNGNAFKVNATGVYLNGVSVNGMPVNVPQRGYAVYSLNASLSGAVLLSGSSSINGSPLTNGTVYSVEFKAKGIFTSVQCTLGELSSTYKNNETISLRSFVPWPSDVKCTGNSTWTEALLYWG